MKPNFIHLTIITLVFTLTHAMGQSYSQPTRMTSPSGSARASLSQDVALLKEQLGEMRFEVERLLRENEALEMRMKKIESTSATAVSEVVFRQELATLKAEFNRLSKTQREELAKQITKQIQELANQVNASGTSSGGTAPPSRPVLTEWDQNSFPKSGIYYKVQSGDTLSKIASEAGSKVSYITHANKIPNPDRLQVGRELFIPIDNP